MGNLYNTISRVLESKLRPRKFEIEPSPAGMEPLFLILTLEPDLVLFSSWIDDYVQAVKKFKELYAIRSTPWAALDLSLVICSEKKIVTREEVVNKIEQDSYFCRKFVIELDSEENFLKGLETLPFMPLSTKEIVTYRPVLDAKKLLIENGFKASLAHDLTTHHIKDANRIVDSLNEDKYGELNWVPMKIEAPNIELGDFGHKIRIKELEISNLRAYKGIHKFNLDADLIVLYGANGLGKTSLFDSIDFVCTGGEATIEDKAGGWETKRIVAALKHLDAREEDSFVKVVINEDNKSYKLERFMNDRTNAIIENESLKRSEVLKKLTGFDDQLTKMHIEKFNQLFRASHLFGQDFQSLTAQLNKNSRLEEEILSKMLAFQDYVEALKKIGDIIVRLKKDNENNEFQIDQLTTTIHKLESELGGAEKSIQPFEEPKMIQEKGESLLYKLKKENIVNVDSDINKFDKQGILEWRLKTEARLREIENRIERLNYLQNKLHRIVSDKENMAKEQKSIEQLKDSIDNIHFKIEEHAKVVEGINSEIEEKVREENRLRKRNLNLEAYFIQKAEYVKIYNDIRNEEKKIRETNEQLLVVIKDLEIATSDNEDLREKEKKISLQLQNHIKISEKLIKLKGIHKEWQQINMQLKDCSLYLLKCEESLKNITNKEMELDTKKKKTLKLKEVLNEKILFIQKSHSGLENILDNIDKFIIDHSCPVCGKNYKSKDELLKKLKARRGKRPVGLDEKMKQSKHFEDLILSLDQERRRLILSKNNLQEEINKTKEKKLNLEKKGLFFEKEVGILNLPPDVNNLNINIQARLKEVNEAIDTEGNEQKALRIKIKEKEAIIANISGERSQKSKQLKIADARKKQLLERMNVLTNEIADKKISLEENEQLLKNEFESNAQKLNLIVSQCKLLRNKFSAAEKEAMGFNSNYKKATDELESKTIKLTEFNNILNEVEQLIIELGLKPDVTTDETRQFEKVLNDELPRIKEIYADIVNFELLFDSAMLSSNSAKIKINIKELKNSVETLEGKRTKNKEYQNTFSLAQEALETTRDKSLKMYIERYGPLASVIQKRLRKPYGFGEIRLRKEKGGFIVEVERKNEKLIPSDYFSASQINIISLSLFLSAALTQTWSKFSTILLDDPVTHFDDLNAYSFIDLIRSIVMSEEPSKGHQFIISTCEDRLYQLLRQKFSMLSGRVKFFVFESIGEKGPIWQEQ